MEISNSYGQGNMKNLEYYMALKYRMEIEETPAELGGGISICVPMLGRESVVADGETYDEARRNLETVKKEFFEHCLSQNIQIPEPEEEQETYSGKFIVRIPKELHRKIAKKAKENNSSLNQFVLYLLQEGLTAEKMEVFAELLKKLGTGQVTVREVAHEDRATGSEDSLTSKTERQLKARLLGTMESEVASGTARYHATSREKKRKKR